MSFEICTDDAVQKDDFFAPVSNDLLDTLLAQYRADRMRVEDLAESVQDKANMRALSFFLEGNKDHFSRYVPDVTQVFRIEGALGALNSHYWSKALSLTDVLDCMPEKRRDEWRKSLSEYKAPDFEEETVRATLQNMLLSRAQFMAERVDGIFRNLSGEHVTNSPMGFGKRMIISYMTSYYGDKTGYINDLRCVIAKMLGFDEPKHGTTGNAVKVLQRNTGVWHELDGGAIKIRLYKKGTAHLEVHPDIAWRLNQILAQLYPMAIPSEFRKKPAKRAKDYKMIQRPLPSAVLYLLGELRRERQGKAFSLSYYSNSAPEAVSEAVWVLESLGGVRREKTYTFDFDYEPREAFDFILTTGCLPDQKTHQYYPTPAGLAQEAAAWADIGGMHSVLEPSAGQGGIADHLPKDQTVCVELSKLHCAVLEGKGFKTECADFLAWGAGKVFDRVVMNPPFSAGRAKAHVEHAAGLLADDGVLVAVLPAGMRGKDLIEGWSHEWSDIKPGEFKDASVAVVLLKLKKA